MCLRQQWMCYWDVAIMQIVLTVRAFKKKNKQQKWLVGIFVMLHLVRQDVCRWMWLAVMSALLLTGLTQTLSLRPGLAVLPACRSPHRGPDWSNRPWTPRPSGPHCGPEISQTANDRAPRHEDEPIATQGWWWMETMRSAACKEKMRTRRCGDTDRWADRQTDIHGCLDRCQHSQHDWPVKTWHT